MNRRHILTVVLAGLLAYAGTLAYDFVWDDTILILDRMHMFELRHLPELLLSDLFGHTRESSQYFRPLVVLSFYLDALLWGVLPLGFHLTNVLAHIAASACVLLLIRRVTGSAVAALAGALLFAVQPAHSDSVAFVSGRTDVFAALFVLVAVLAYARWRERGGLGFHVLSLGAFALALLSKEVAAVLPALLALYDRTVLADLRSRRALREGAWRYAPYGGVLAGYAVLRGIALRGTEVAGEPWADTLPRILSSVRAAAWYAWLSVVPYPRNLYHWLPVESVPPAASWWLAAGLVSALVVLTLVALRRWPTVGFGLSWFWLGIAPALVVNAMPNPMPVMAERFLYLPSVGICLLAGLAAVRALGSAPISSTGHLTRPVPALACAVVLVLFTMLTLHRNEDWKDQYRLSTRMAETSPGVVVAQLNAGLAHLRQGEMKAAHEHLERAVSMSPNNPHALAALGLAETILGRPEAGLEHALKALRIRPSSAGVQGFLADVYAQRGELDKAVPPLTEAIRLNPNHIPAHLNLVMYYLGLDRQAEAQSALVRVLALNRTMRVSDPQLDRVQAEVYGRVDPERSRQAWERYLAALKAIPDRTSLQDAAIAYAEEQLARLAGRAS